MTDSPMAAHPLFHVGTVPIDRAVVTTWVLMAVLTLASRALGRRLDLAPGRAQAVAEMLVEGLTGQIEATLGRPPGPYLPLIGTLFVFIAAANLSPLIPGVVAPTAKLETAAALALTVFFAVHWYGLRALGVWRYLGHYLKPNPVMLPVNVLSELTRTLSLTVRLFGNVMSHEVVLGVLLSLAGLLVPIPIMALGVVIGLIQAYIFAVLATIYLGAAIGAVQSH